MNVHVLALSAVAAALVSSSPTHAASSASARISNFGYQLIDLNPQDGIDPVISFSSQESSSYANVGSDSDYQWAMGWYQPTLVAVGGTLAQAMAWTDASGASASGWAAGSSFNAYGQPVYGWFTLTPWTGIILSLDFDGTATTTLGGDEYASAYAYLQVDISQPGGWENHSAYRQVYVGSNPGTASFAGSFTLSYANLSNATVNGQLYATGSSYGYSANPIPEPATVALMLAGLAAVGGIARRRRGT